MKAKGLSLLTLALLISGCAGEPNTNFINQSNILGAWDCSYTIIHDEGGETSKASIETKDDYLRNGRSNSFGIMKLKISPEFPEIEYSIAGTSSWEITGKYLVQQITDLKIVNLSHPELDSIIKIQDMFPQGISESSEILKLTTHEMILRSESTNDTYKCNKAF